MTYLFIFGIYVLISGLSLIFYLNLKGISNKVQAILTGWIALPLLLIVKLLRKL